MIKNVLASIIGTMSIGSIATAEFVVVNNPVNDTVGFYSDGFDSKGSYTYAQSGAQKFTTEEDYTMSSVRWWGSSNGFNGQGISNIQAFQLIVWDSDFNQQCWSSKINISNVTATATGDENFYGHPVYEFYVPVSFNLEAGSYFMNIGALLNDGQGDQFVWSQGQDINNFWQTSPFGQGGWGSWHPLPPSLIGTTPGGAFVMSAPSPGAIALLALAGLVSRRRR